MTAQMASRKLAAVAALTIALMMGLALALPAQALADETALTAGSQADDGAKVINTAKSYTWVKVGKKVYQWGNYSKKIANGTLSPREVMSTYFEPSDTMDGDKLSITNVTTSDASIINPKAVTKYFYMKYTSKKTGTATVTYTMGYTNDSGDAVVENVTETHKVVKYTRPIKSFKVGGKNYASKFKKTPQVNAKSSLSGKVAVKAASGWKVKKIRQVNSRFASGEGIPQKKLKNGGKVNIGKSDSSAIEVICYNTKGKYYSSVVLAPNFTYGSIAG